MSEARAAAVVVAFAALAACRPSGAPPVPAADSAPVATIDVADAATPDAAATSTSTSTRVTSPIASASALAVAPDDAATANRPLTPIAKLAKITLEQSQGGLSFMRCNGLTYSVSVDLAKNEWTYGRCVPTAAGRPTAQTPLSLTTGKLKPEQRARLDASYARMSIETALGCGHDGGPLTLRLDRRGGSETYVDENWGCEKPAPEIAKGVNDLATTMMLIVNAP